MGKIKDGRGGIICCREAWLYRAKCVCNLDNGNPAWVDDNEADELLLDQRYHQDNIKSFRVEALPDIPVSLVKQEYITSGMLHESTCQKGKEYCIDESPTLSEIYLGYKPLGRQSEHPLSALYEGDNQRLPHLTMVVEHYSEEEASEGIRTHDLAYILWRRKCGNGPEYLSPRYNASGQDTGFGDTQPFKVFKQDFDEEQSHFDSDYIPQLRVFSPKPRPTTHYTTIFPNCSGTA
ncbi:hypothetical protein CDV55_101704 [Aspergillus turcosus]|nr:hypothetical protein CDV55_101704 [Aspergillus turcosus]